MVAPLDIKERDYFGAYREGVEFRENRRAQKRQDAAREGLGRYLSSGDRTGLDQAYQNDPGAAAQAEQGQRKQQGDAQQVAANFASAWKSAPAQAKPSLIAAARRTVASRPDLQQVLGDQFPQSDDPAEWDNYLGQGQLYAEPEKFSNAGNGFLVGTSGNTRRVEGYEAPSRSKLVMVPDGQGGQVQMLYDPDTQSFSQPNYDSQPPQQNAPQQVNAPGADDAVVAQANQMAQQGVPYAQIEAWMQQQLDGRVPGQEGAPAQQTPPQQQPAQAPQRAPASRSAYADTPLDQVGGGDPGPRMGYKPPPSSKQSAKGPPSGAKAPSGYRWTGEGAKLEPIPGGPADRSQKGGAARPQAPVRPTEDMNKSATYVARMDGAIADVARYEKEEKGSSKRSIGTAVADALLPDEVANYTKSAGRQNVEAAQLDALDAALTLNTGAAYTKEQLKGLAKAYFPEAGNPQSVIDEKNLRFKRLVDSARIRAGSAGQSANTPTAADADARLPQMDGGPAKVIRYNAQGKRL
jgi:hypothetical protein